MIQFRRLFSNESRLIVSRVNRFSCDFIFIHLKANKQLTKKNENIVIDDKNDGSWSDIFSSEIEDFSPDESVVSDWKPLGLSYGDFLAKTYYGPVIRGSSQINYTTAADICAGYEARLI